LPPGNGSHKQFSFCSSFLAIIIQERHVPYQWGEIKLPIGALCVVNRSTAQGGA